MELFILAGVNVAVWNLAYQKHKEKNDPNILYDRGLGDRRGPGLGVNELRNPETGKLYTSTQMSPQYEYSYRKRLSRRPDAVKHDRIDPYRKDTENNMKSNRFQALHVARGTGTFADLAPGGRGRLLVDDTVTVTQMPIHVNWR